MSYQVGSLTAYVDEHKLDLIAASTVGAKTAQMINIQAGIKGSATINIIDSPVTFQADDCAWNASGNTTFTQRTITVGDIKVNESFCNKDLDGYYLQTMLKASANEEAKDMPFEQIFMEEKSNNMAYEVEKAIWQGDTGGAGNLAFFDGLLKLIDAASPVDGNVDGVTVATGITVANIIDILYGIKGAIPEAILDKDDVKIFMGTDTFRKYEEAIFAANLFHYTSENGDMELPLVGSSSLKVVAVSGLTGTNRIIAARTSNLYLGVDMAGDEERFDLFYSQDNRQLRLDVSFKMGTQVAFPTEVTEFTLVP